MNKKIAIIGGGIFGVTTAIKLGNKNDVYLYEQQNDILNATSRVNQYRLHRGYHYPRSKETVLSLIKAEKEFKKEFKECIVKNTENYYCIAKKGSLTTAKEYLAFCSKFNLQANITKLSLINENNIDLCIKAKENIFDVDVLRKTCWEKLKKAKVNVLLNTKASKKIFKKYDHVVICVYGFSNHFLNKQKTYQYELCEKPVVKLPKEFNNKCIVIMDGPFMCVDTFGKTGNFLLGNVRHAIHKTNIGKKPIIDKKFIPLLNKGVIKNPPITNFNLFIDSGKKYIPKIKYAKHIGSMFTIRTVLPYKDKTDERPTLVKQNSKKIISVFSGKIPNCVEAANRVKELINA